MPNRSIPVLVVAIILVVAGAFLVLALRRRRAHRKAP
jgi:hypothetical protein